MKSRERICWYKRCWVVALSFALLMASPFVAARSQTSKLKITAADAHSTFEHGLSQPTKFLQDIGITPEEVQRELEPRARISVVGASFTRDVGLVVFADVQNAQVRSIIQVKGAGSARVLGLVAFMESSNPSPRSSIHVAGAGFVRDINLVAPPSP